MACKFCRAIAATVFITPYYKSIEVLRREIYRAARTIFFVALVIFLADIARAGELSVKAASLTPTAQGYTMNAEFNLKLNPTLEDALERGVVLFFVIESRIWQPRWWWFNKTIASAQEIRKLSYNSLTRQYRLSAGNNYQNFNSLDDAEASVAQLHDQIIAEPNALNKENTHRASVRMWLDVTQLPKPFQVKAVTATEWKLDSNEWVFDVTF